MLMIHAEGGANLVPCGLHFALIPVLAQCSCLCCLFSANPIRQWLKPERLLWLFPNPEYQVPSAPGDTSINLRLRSCLFKGVIGTRNDAGL